jgi:drug/metabolite transporter (DMT)-like permease
MPRIFPFLMLIASALCLSLGIVVAKHLVGGIDPIVFLIVQLGASLTFLWAVAIAQGASIGPLGNIAPLVGLGILIGVAAICTIIALRLINASQASLIFATQPALIVALAWPLLGEKPTFAVVVLSILALSGVAAVIGGMPLADNMSLAGSMTALLSTVIAALYVVWMRKLTISHDPLKSLAIIQSTAWLVALLALPFDNGFQEVLAAPMTAVAWLAVALSGFLQYGLGYWLYLIGLRKVRAGIAGLYLNLCPLFVIGLAYIFLGESLTLTQWAGAVAILFAVTAMSLVDLFVPSDAPARTMTGD